MYRASLQFSGAFRLTLPPDLPAANLNLAEARICIGISDFKGIEDKINMQLNNTAYGLQPGLPIHEIDKSGLSAPVVLTAVASTASIPFSLFLQLRGTAIVSLTTHYVKGHFNSWKVAGIFAETLCALYGFIFNLIQLEDTALLVGSIGLFAVLALVMYASRRINWYGYKAMSDV